MSGYRASLCAVICMASFAGHALAAEWVGSGTFTPGALIIGQTEPANQVSHDDVPVRVTKHGTFLIGLGRDATGTTVVSITAPDGSTSETTHTIGARAYDIQRIDGLPSKQVTPDPDTVARIQQEGALIRKARQSDLDTPYFETGFVWPLIGTITGVYGSQRILNGEPRSPHKGVDIAAPEGTPFVAMADGRVSLVHPDMFYTGQTVILDHGHGLTSIYIHMNQITVREGERVSKGQVIGHVGATGRATGPHLHWGITLGSKHLDPELVAGPMPAP